MEELGNDAPVLTGRLARTASDAALRWADQAGLRVSVVILDAAGRVKTMTVQDEALLTSPTFAEKKAFTALAFKAPPESLPMAQDPIDALRVMTTDSRLIFVGGGLPLRVAEVIVGAIGVAGGRPEDDRACCEAAVVDLALHRS